jgi:xanthine dehydrogenase accessory factor
MNPTGSLLDDFFADHRSRGEPLVVATIVSTLGSTYRKAGAQMLIAADGAVAGLLSGGCLEGDLAAHAAAVLESGEPKIVEYDTRGSDDLVWGIGLGCEGAMHILLTRLGPDNDYQPFAYRQRCRTMHRPGSFVFVVKSHNPQFPLGSSYHGHVTQLPTQVTDALDGNRISRVVTASDAEFLVVPVELPPRLLVLGAGPDAMPLVEIAGLLGWHVTVLDHRPAYAIAERFPRAREVKCQPVAALSTAIADQPFDAAVVMSHHLPSDAGYLSALATSPVGYVGLLGPAPRRQRLLSDIGPLAAELAPRLYGPVGLDIGANTPETIALAIVSEVQAVLANRSGGSFSTQARAAS